MTCSRRSLLAAGATGALALSAGCLDFALGNGPLEFSAQRVAPTDAALEDAGYTEDEVSEESIEETIDVGVEREIRASMWTSLYSKERELEDESREASLFAAVSLPAIEVLGRSFNPLDDLTNEELLEEILDEFDGEGGDVKNIEHKDSFGLDILGDGREVDVFIGETEYVDRTVEVELALTSFTHEDDLIVLLGSYPRQLAEESANVEELMESVEHPL